MSDTIPGTPSAPASAPPQTAPELREQRFDFVDGSILIKLDSGAQFTFKIPSIMDYAAIGGAAAAMRRTVDPQRMGNLAAFDSETADLCWGFAAFNTLLKSTSERWLLAADAVGKPTVNPDTIPVEYMDDFLIVTGRLDEAISRFRKNGTAIRQSMASKTVVAQ